MPAPIATRKLHLLRELLSDNLNRSQLAQRLGQDQKMVERTLKALKNENEFVINGHNHVIEINPPEEFTAKLVQVFEEVVQTEHPTYAYGQISYNLMQTGFHDFWGQTYLEAINKFLFIIRSIHEGTGLKFSYRPQTKGTLIRWRNLLKFITQISISERRKDVLPVKTIPSCLVFSNHTILLLCETEIHGVAQVRQYDLRGIPTIDKIEIIPDKKRHLGRLDARKIYQNSMDTWIGGKIHKLTLRRIQPDSEEPITEHRIVNGEKEIVDYLLQSQGEVRIVNPPQELQSYLKHLKKDPNEFFIFE